MLDVEFEHPSDLPRGDDLPDEDGIPLDNEVHREQASIYLIEPLKRWLRQQSVDAFVGGNSFVYYSPSSVSGRKGGNPKPRRLGPDVYVVMGGQSRGQKKWVVWEEGGLYPSLAIELLSPATEGQDRGQKFVIYRDQWKMKDYFLFETDSAKLEGFCLRRRAYFSTEDEQGLHPCSCLPLRLGVRDGWLRWFDLDGQVLPTADERAQSDRRCAEQAEKRAEQAERRADHERERADRLEARLRELGLEP
ncbi:Uma2 family endonuclease [bacterium]|nr:Uma2 family endonuclease [bacterium]